MVFVSRVNLVNNGSSPFLSRTLGLVYRLYERSLSRGLRAQPMPQHIGIILDGNRRHGMVRGLTEPREIYRAGADKLEDVLEWCVELGIPAVTLWVLSTDNLRRSRHEVSGILAAIEAKLRDLLRSPMVRRHRIRVRAVGRLSSLPASLFETIRETEQATEHFSGLNVTIAVAYGGREEIIDAMRALLQDLSRGGKTLAQSIDAVSPEAIGRYIYRADLPDLDLIIRTSGEVRHSGFLLWQSMRSEFYCSDVFWPAFRRIDFLRAIREFQRRRRRYGA
ncbi:MAG TPA: polyprenyl diphosphate synthase [Stellaceae bacterium]|nr:polyprenyl diphosphate synthase [Stellaceae bacterium]